MNQTTKTKIINEVYRYIRIANAEYGQVTIPMPLVKFSNRMTKCSGKARLRYDKTDPQITFSIPIIDSNDFDDFIGRTVPHEVAHVVEWYVYNTAGHGYKFKNIMRNVFNVSSTYSTRCHSYKTPPKQKFTYVCSDCGTKARLGKTQHARFQNGTRYYGCAVCTDRSTFKRLTYLGEYVPA